VNLSFINISSGPCNWLKLIGHKTCAPCLHKTLYHNPETEFQTESEETLEQTGLISTQTFAHTGQTPTVIVVPSDDQTWQWEIPSKNNQTIQIVDFPAARRSIL